MPEKRKITGCCFVPCPVHLQWADVRWVGFPGYWGQAAVRHAVCATSRGEVERRIPTDGENPSREIPKSHVPGEQLAGAWKEGA